MPQTDTAALLWRDLVTAFGLLTRFPLPVIPPSGANAAWAWPVAGAAVALIAGLVAMAGLWAGLPPLVAAGLAIAVQIGLTGAMHEDGLADSADGLWGGHDRVRRLEIMKDSRIGSYGVLALLLVVGLRWQALAALFHLGAVIGPLLAAAVLSRAAMAVVLVALPNARGSGLANQVGRPEPFVALAGGGLALGLALLAVGWLALPAALVAGTAALAVAALARGRIGGQTGDILGFVQQMAELAVLLALAIWL